MSPKLLLLANFGVALPMLVELGLSFALLAYRPESFSMVLAGLALALTLLIWACTFFASVPLHGQLGAGGFDVAVIAQLVRTNWVRTLAWTARALILGFGKVALLTQLILRAADESNPFKHPGKGFEVQRDNEKV